jgi:MFS family permease
VIAVFPQWEKKKKKRALANCSHVHQVIGPIVGGYIGKGVGWRWAFWIIAIFSGTLQIFFVFFLRETYKVQILKRQAQRLQKQTNNPNFRSKYTVDRTSRQLFREACIRPLYLLFTSPILFVLSLYISVVYGYLYLIITTITEVFESKYGFSEGSVDIPWAR